MCWLNLSESKDSNYSYENVLIDTYAQTKNQSLHQVVG